MKTKASRTAKLLHFSAFIICLIVCFCGWRVAKKFGVVTLDQILFHLMAPLDGIDTELIHWSIRYLCITAAFIAGYYVLFFNNTICSKISQLRGIKAVYRPQSSLWHIGMAVILIVISVLYAELKYNAITYLSSNESLFIENNYVYVRGSDVHFENNTSESSLAPKKRNAIVLLLESMENTYGDTTIFPESLTPRLTQLQKENIAFSRQHQLYGTGWTIAGLTSYLFGVPLMLFKNAGDVLFDKFMPEASSVLDILSFSGYTLEYVLSGSIIFAGTDKMFNSHSKTFIQDANYLGKYKDKNMTGLWGVPDSFMYSWAKKRYMKLLESGQPFVLFVQSIDTHGHKGYLEPQNDHGRGYRDVLAAADTMAAEFLQWVQQQPDAESTTIIVLGDHLMGRCPLSDDFLDTHPDKRFIFNLFINAQAPETLRLDRPCASFDMAPTLLESMGIMLPRHRLGLGVSLFSKEKTLMERMGKDALDAELRHKSTFYQRLFLPEKP